MRLRALLVSAVIATVALLGGAVLLPGGEPTAAAGSAAPTPDDATLALDLLQRAREEAAPHLLLEAEAALARSLAEQPEANVPAYVGMGALSNARHDFSASVTWARRAITANPYNASAYGLLGDALFELGRVRASVNAYQDMVDLRPDAASYIRASYAQQHMGATAAAIRSLKLARQAAGPTGESPAFVEHQLGDVYAGLGRYDKAETANRRGVAMAPGYIPPTVGIAEAYLATGRLDEAIPILEHAVEELPSLEYMVTLGDVYTAAGRTADAEAIYQRASGVLAAYRRNGVLPDSDFILFYADRKERPRAALREAFAIYENRPTAKVADALAWMLHSVGRSDDARPYASQAVRGPGASAEALFHAAQIERRLGNDSMAARHLRQALRLDPAFSVVDAPTARRQLEELP
jgi:tetratricopeptide (TPR) repeat protein